MLEKQVNQIRFVVALAFLTSCTNASEVIEATNLPPTVEPTPTQQANPEDYLPLPGIVLPTPPVAHDENGVWVMNPPNTIFEEFSGLKQSDILNKIIELIDERHEGLGFPICNSERLSGLFLPFEEYRNINFIEDNDTGMIIVDNAEVSAVLDPWGITVPSYGRLELSEIEFVGEVLAALLNGRVGACWGGPLADELILYGDLQGMFDQIYARYTDIVEA